MSPIAVSIVLGFVVLVLFAFLVYFAKKRKRHQAKLLLSRLSKLAEEQGLVLSSQDVFSRVAIGLDGIHRKLLVAERVGDHVAETFVIDLHEVRSCSVIKKYRSDISPIFQLYPAGILETVSLRFDWTNEKPSTCVNLYSHLHDHQFVAAGLERRAEDWKAVLSKLRRPPARA